MWWLLGSVVWLLCTLCMLCLMCLLCLGLCVTTLRPLRLVLCVHVCRSRCSGCNSNVSCRCDWRCCVASASQRVCVAGGCACVRQGQLVFAIAPCVAGAIVESSERWLVCTASGGMVRKRDGRKRERQKRERDRMVWGERQRRSRERGWDT